MSKPAFTPGPWQTDAECGDESVLGPDGAMVADCAIFGMRVNRTEHINRANARLIAAAPDMYEALQATLLFHSASPWDCEKQNRWRELTGKDEATTRALCDLVRAALAKAEGRAV